MFLIVTMLPIASWNAIPATAQTVTFPNGVGKVDVPLGYDSHFDSEGTLQLLERSAKNVRVFASFYAIEVSDAPPNVGVLFVRFMAKQKNYKLLNLGGRVMIVEPERTTRVNGRRIVNKHWTIGFGKSYVTLSTAISDDQTNSPQARRFFEKHFDPLIRSFRIANH